MHRVERDADSRRFLLAVPLFSSAPYGARSCVNRIARHDASGDRSFYRYQSAGGGGERVRAEESKLSAAGKGGVGSRCKRDNWNQRDRGKNCPGIRISACKFRGRKERERERERERETAKLISRARHGSLSERGQEISREREIPLSFQRQATPSTWRRPETRRNPAREGRTP